MSAEALMAPPDLSLSESICTLLKILTRGARREDSLRLEARGGTARLGVSETSIRASDVSDRWLPPTVLRVLEGEAATPWAVHLPVMAGPTGRVPVSVSALAAGWIVQKVYLNPKAPDSPHGRRWVWPDGVVGEILTRLEGGALPPTLVLDARPIITAIWALDGPLPVRDPAAAARVSLLLRALAVTVGAVVPAKDVPLADLAVPLPGTAAQSQHEDVASIVSCNPMRVYRIEDVEAAIGAAREE